MKKRLILSAFLFCAAMAHGQVNNPPIKVVPSTPSGPCTGNLPDQQVATLGTLYSCQNGTIGQIGSGGGSSTVAILPGTPNVVYTFVAPGDQTGTTVHDISGNGNNGTISQPPSPGNYWTGTGFTLANQAAGTAVFTPVTAGTNQTHCMTVYLPFYGVAGANNVPSALLLSTGGGHGWYATQTNAQIYGVQVFEDNINNGGGSTLDALPVEAGFHTRCVVFRSGQTNRIFIDGVEPSYASTSTDVFSGTWALAYVSSNNTAAVFYYYAEWNSVLSDAQILQASLAMNAAVANRGAQTVPVRLVTTKPVIHTQGDSITCCAGASTTQWYPTLLSVNAAYTSVVNEGFPGAPVLTFAEAALWRDTPSCSSGGQPTLVTIFGGTNDGFFGATAAATFNYIQYDVNVLKAAAARGRSLNRLPPGAPAAQTPICGHPSGVRPVLGLPFFAGAGGETGGPQPAEILGVGQRSRPGVLLAQNPDHVIAVETELL